MPHPGLSPERVSEIPVLEIDWDEMSGSQRGIIPVPLGRDYSSYSTTGQYTSQMFDRSWEIWQKQRPWVPVKNRKQLPLARAFYLNPEAREFVEKLDPGTGAVMFEDMTIKAGTEHLPRLLTTTEAPVLTDFSLAYAGALIPHDPERLDYIFQALPGSRDGNGGCQFWGIAPYIFDRLRNPGPGMQALTPRQAIDTVIDWSNARKRYDTDNAIYPGFYSDYLDQGFYLHYSGTHPSHALAGRIGTHIADQLRLISPS